jgi:hypothetical protein
MRNEYKILAGKPEGKRPLRSRYRREDNIITELRKIRILVWIGFFWLRIGIVDGIL